MYYWCKGGQINCWKYIWGAFEYEEKEKDLHMLQEGDKAETNICLEPGLYQKFIWRNKQCKIYVIRQVEEALDGTLVAVLLFGKLFSYTLTE